jgi:hypothetical protein
MKTKVLSLAIALLVALAIINIHKRSDLEARIEAMEEDNIILFENYQALMQEQSE